MNASRFCSISSAAALLGAALAACNPPPPAGSDGATPGTDAGPPPAPELGTGDHSAASVTLTTIADSTASLAGPRDLAFNPLRPDELWVVNHDTDSVTIIHDASQPTRTTEWRLDGYALHFMAEPSAIAFGADATSAAPIPAGVGGLPGTFSTCGESRNTYNDMAAPNDFMGVALWSSDLSVFAMYNPFGLGSHLDMLHCTPLCMGLAHEGENVYWTISGRSNDGLSPAITRYDFAADNGVGNDNHSDGVAWRYAEGMVGYAPGIPSHLVYDAPTQLLYVADTANGRILALDTASGTMGAPLQPFEPMAEYRRIDGAVITEVVTAASGLLQSPSGLELRNDLLYVSDNANGRFFAVGLDGTLANYLDTGLPPGSLAGFAFGPDGRIYFVDMLQDRVVRIDP